MRVILSPRTVSRLSALVMTAILVGMVGLTVSTLIRTRSAMSDVNRSVEVGEAYSNAANDISLSAMYLANFLRTQDLADMQQYARVIASAWAQSDVVRAKGTDQDRAALDAIAAKNAEGIAKSEAQLAAIARGESGLLDSVSTQQVTAVAAEVSGLAHQQHADALLRSEAANRDLRRDSLLTVIVFALGLPIIGATYMVNRHYERKDLARQAEVSRLREAALTDGLTGLANHRAFQEDLQREVARAARSDIPISVAMIDIDDFKEVNDSRGHAQGDVFLAELAKLMSYLRSQDRCYRVGGDEFALIMTGTDAPGALDALQRLRASVVNGLNGRTISIGVSSSGAIPFRAETLRDHADAALYEAKHLGKNQVVQYKLELGEMSDLTAAKMQAIRRVLGFPAVTMWFQPIYRIGSVQLMAFEALLRLPQEPAIAGPTEAFEVAQHMGRTRDLDLLCISSALDSAHELPPDAKLFMNINPATLIHTDFSANDLLKLVNQHEFDPARVVFEITERTPAPLPRIARQVEALRDCGFAIALDDVGSGNAGLEMLRLIKFDYVKIDRSVILDALDSGPGRAVILAIVAFARETGAFMIAEGIETKEMLESIKFDEHGLRQFWVQGVQGFLMGEPGASIRAFLDEKRPRTTRAA